MAFLEYGKIDAKTEKRLDDLIKNKNFKNYWRRKRTFDLIVTGLLLLILIIPFGIIALLVFLDDPHGSPFYKQIRIGRHGKEFEMYKFRTMYVDADQRKAELMAQNEMDGPVFKLKNDPRITKVGRFIRRASIDELPQLWNVLKGDMSLVGPRPPLVREVEKYTEHQKLRLTVTPGMTCYWQVQPKRNSIPFERWLELDIKYIRERSILLDIKLLFLTIGAVFGLEGE